MKKILVSTLWVTLATLICVSTSSAIGPVACHQCQFIAAGCFGAASEQFGACVEAANNWQNDCLAHPNKPGCFGGETEAEHGRRLDECDLQSLNAEWNCDLVEGTCESTCFECQPGGGGDGSGEGGEGGGES